MVELEKGKLVKYLEHAIELEGNIVTHQEIIKSFRQRADIREPHLRSMGTRQSVPPYDPPVVQAYSGTKPYGTLSFIIGLAMVIVCLFVVILEVSIWGDQLRDPNSYSYASMRTWHTWSWIGVAAGVVILCIPFFQYSRKKKAYEEEMRRRKEEYDKTYEELKKTAAELNAKIDASNSTLQKMYQVQHEEWRKSKDDALSLLNARKRESETVLRDYYAPDYIYPKYRNLPAITSIYEYLASGRCDELTGPNGAYNLYESELRQNLIINQLSTIISNLEQIRQNQFMLYQEVAKINATTYRIASEISDISGYTFELTRLSALNAYYSAVTAANTSAIAYLNAIN